jgi:hypothetical protein
MADDLRRLRHRDLPVCRDSVVRWLNPVHPGYFLPTAAGGLIGASAAAAVHLQTLAEASFASRAAATPDIAARPGQCADAQVRPPPR